MSISSPGGSRRVRRATESDYAAHLALCLAALAYLGSENAARGYPEFQFSTGNARCNLCHYSPTGGGLLNDWGRRQSASAISFGDGNGDFLYGVYKEPAWIKLGVDFRGAAIVKKQPSTTDVLAFPMLGDTYVRLQKDSLSFYAAIGPRAQARDSEHSVLSRMTSREHYAMWKPRGTKAYVRAGRFLAPDGIRSQNHTLYVRRDLGLYAYEETYNVSGGYVDRNSELHVTAFTPAPQALQAAGPRESGGAAYYEHRFDQRASLAGQTKIGFSGDGAHYWGGGLGKLWLPSPHLLLTGELDFGVQTFDASPGPTREQLVSYAGVSWFPRPGLLTTVAHEHYNEDLSVKGTSRHGLSLSIQVFPWVKWEVQVLGKVEFDGSTQRKNSMGMLQIHYYL